MLGGKPGQLLLDSKMQSGQKIQKRLGPNSTKQDIVCGGAHIALKAILVKVLIYLCWLINWLLTNKKQERNKGKWEKLC